MAAIQGCSSSAASHANARVVRLCLPSSAACLARARTSQHKARVVCAAKAFNQAAWRPLCAAPPVRRTRTVTASAVAAVAAAPSPAWSQLLANVLGYGVLVGSCFRSVPQIAKIMRQGGNTEGLSLTANVVELLVYTVMLAYNMQHGYPFSTYGELVACWVQDVLLVGLILRHLRSPASVTISSTAAFGVVCGALFWPGVCSPEVLSALQLSTLFVLAVGSRMPQIVLNFRRGNAGIMSLTTALLNVVGNLIRLFTTLTLTQDKLLVLGCVSQGVLNTIIFAQVLHTRLAGMQVDGPAVVVGPASTDTEPPPGGPLLAK